MRTFFLLFLMIPALAGCSLIPDFQQPAVETPMNWHGNVASSGPSSIAGNWWRSFGSEELNVFMAQALENNNNLQAGIQRVAQSRASLKAAGASLLPAADASAGTGRSLTNPISGNTTYSSNWQTGARISYELDLFGANRADIESARAGLAAAQFDQEALRLVTMGDVARQYFLIINLRNRLEIANNNLDIAYEVLRIVKARLDAGTETALVVAQQKSSLATSEAAQASLAQQLQNAEYAFSILLAKPPQHMGIQARNLALFTVPAIAPGQPSELLHRRPDLRSAEADLASANADIGAARAAFFPRVNLGLDWGISAAGFGKPTATAGYLASSLTAPIFQGGRLEAGVEQAKARHAELLENYQQTVLTAFGEAEDALTAVKITQEREQLLAAAMSEAQKSYALTRQLYDSGRIDFQTLLDVQGTLLNSEDSFAQARLERLFAAVDLYLALGGGWRASQ